jgi:hypothetical protein
MTPPKNPIGIPRYDHGAPALLPLKQLAALYADSSVQSITVRYNLCINASLCITSLEFGFTFDDAPAIRPPSGFAIARTLEIFKDLLPALVGIPQPPYYQEISGSFRWELWEPYGHCFTHTHTLETQLQPPGMP